MIDAEKANYTISRMCRLLNIDRRRYYEWAKRRAAGPSAAEQRRAELTGKIVAKAREKGLILLSCGTYYNVVRFLMPVTIPDAQLEKGIAIVAECFDELA